MVKIIDKVRSEGIIERFGFLNSRQAAHRSSKEISKIALDLKVMTAMQQAFNKVQVGVSDGIAHDAL